MYPMCADIKSMGHPCWHLLACSSDGGLALTELHHVARLVDASLTRAAQFLVTTFREQQRLFDDPISELRIGIFSNSTRSVVTVHEHACLSEVLDLLETHGETWAVAKRFCRGNQIVLGLGCREKTVLRGSHLFSFCGRSPEITGGIFFIVLFLR